MHWGYEPTGTLGNLHLVVRPGDVLEEADSQVVVRSALQDGIAANACNAADTYGALGSWRQRELRFVRCVDLAGPSAMEHGQPCFFSHHRIDAVIHVEYRRNERVAHGGPDFPCLDCLRGIDIREASAVGERRATELVDPGLHRDTRYDGLAFPFAFRDGVGPCCVLYPGDVLDVYTSGQIRERFVVGEQQIDISTDRDEVLVTVPVGVRVESGAEGPICPTSDDVGQVFHIPGTEPIGHLAVVGADDVRGDVIGGCLKLCSFEDRVVVQDLEVHRYPVFFLKGLDDLIDEELLLAGGAEEA